MNNLYIPTGVHPPRSHRRWRVPSNHTRRSPQRTLVTHQLCGLCAKQNHCWKILNWDWGEQTHMRSYAQAPAERWTDDTTNRWVDHCTWHPTVLKYVKYMPTQGCLQGLYEPCPVRSEPGLDHLLCVQTGCSWLKSSGTQHTYRRPHSHTHSCNGPLFARCAIPVTSTRMGGSCQHRWEVPN